MSRARRKQWTLRTVAVFLASFPILEGISNAGLGVGTKIVGAGVVTAWLIESVAQRRIRVHWTIAILVPYVAWVAGSTFWSPLPTVTIRYAVNVGLAALLFSILVDVLETEADIIVALRAYVVGVTILMATAIHNILSNITYAGTYNRFSAIGSDPNSFALYVVSTIPLALSPSLWQFKGATLVRGVYLLLSTFVVVSSGSRGAVGALLVISFIVGANLVRKNWTRAPLRIAGALAMLAVILPAALHYAPDQSLTRVTIGADDAAGGRLPAWGHALEFGYEYPLLGLGAATLVYQTTAEHADGLQAHNTFLSHFAELGVPGATLWVVLWAAFVLLAFRQPVVGRDINKAILAVLVVALIGAATLNWETRKLVYLAFAFVVSGHMLPRQPSKSRAVHRTEIVIP